MDLGPLPATITAGGHEILKVHMDPIVGRLCLDLQMTAALAQGKIRMVTEGGAIAAEFSGGALYIDPSHIESRNGGAGDLVITTRDPAAQQWGTLRMSLTGAESATNTPLLRGDQWNTPHYGRGIRTFPASSGWPIGLCGGGLLIVSTESSMAGGLFAVGGPGSIIKLADTENYYGTIRGSGQPVDVYWDWQILDPITGNQSGSYVIHNQTGVPHDISWQVFGGA